MRFGLVMQRNGKEIGAGVNVRRLTFDPLGRTNNTCLRFEQNDERLFGSGSKGHWQESARSGRTTRATPDGVKSVWLWDDNKIEVSQFVELIRGEQSGLLDTCRVRYVIDNRDTSDHTVGIRFLLDTFIGGNDGVPFTIPRRSRPVRLTMKDLPSQAADKKIPDFLQSRLKSPTSPSPAPSLTYGSSWKTWSPRPASRSAPGRMKSSASSTRKPKARSTLWDVPLVPLKSARSERLSHHHLLAGTAAQGGRPSGEGWFRIRPVEPAPAREASLATIVDGQRLPSRWRTDGDQPTSIDPAKTKTTRRSP